MVDPEGPPCRNACRPTNGNALSQAMSDRGHTGCHQTARMRPWYVALMLGVSPCNGPHHGRAGRRVRRPGPPAGGRGAGRARPSVRWSRGTPSSVCSRADARTGAGHDPRKPAGASYADDYAVTLTDAYFDGDVWKIWEFGRFDAYANSDCPGKRSIARWTWPRTRLMDDRNRAWIAPLLEGAAEAVDEELSQPSVRCTCPERRGPVAAAGRGLHDHPSGRGDRIYWPSGRQARGHGPVSDR